MSSQQYEKQVLRYMKALKGEGFKSRYKGTNLMILEDGEQSVAERSSRCIAPPKRYAGESSRPGGRKPAGRKRQQEIVVDPSFVREIIDYQ